MTEIKICGITNLNDAAYAVERGADALGFNFFAKSPRYVCPEAVKNIIENIPEGITKVGVFVNHDPLEVRKTIEYCGLDLIQLHGGESLAYCRRFLSSLLIKAFSLRNENDLRKVRRYSARAILVDAYDPSCYGGTGRKSRWGLAAGVKKTHALILAGGLNPDNIREAIETVSPDAVDVNSGVERSPGRKDRRKVNTIVEIVRGISKSERKVFRP